MHVLLAALTQTHAVPDTVVTRIVPAAATGFERTVAAAGAFAVLLAYLVFGAAIVAAMRMRKAMDDARQSLDRVGEHLRTLTDRANAIAQDLAAVTESVRDDVTAVHDTVEYANQRARQAIAGLADRVDSFNAAMESVQRDTQDVVVSAVAALRGVQAGVSALRERPVKRQRSAAPPTEPPDDSPPDLPARPRLRRRARSDT